MENIYSRKVFEDYQRRCTAVMGRPWHQGMMSEYFLWRVDSSHKQRSASQGVLSATIGHVHIPCPSFPHVVPTSFPAILQPFQQTPLSHAASRPWILHCHF